MVRWQDQGPGVNSRFTHTKEKQLVNWSLSWQPSFKTVLHVCVHNHTWRYAHSCTHGQNDQTTGTKPSFFFCVCFFQIVRVGYVRLGKDLSNTSHVDARFRNNLSYSNCLLIFPKWCDYTKQNYLFFYLGLWLMITQVVISNQDCNLLH